MSKAKRTLFNVVLGAIACIFIVGLSASPSFSQVGFTAAFNRLSASTLPRQDVSNPALVQPQTTGSQTTEAGLMAQRSTGAMQLYSVMLMNQNVVPKAPSTSASGMAVGVLMGDRLMVKGEFSGLSSALRDYATDPVNPPNPKITSAVHVHRGEATQNGPFQYPLTVTLDATGLSGKFVGEYALTPEQLQALSEGKLYIDIHTKQNRAGELRGIFRML